MRTETNPIEGGGGEGTPIGDPVKTFLRRAVKPLGLTALLISLYVFKSTPMVGPPTYLIPAALGTLMLALLRKEVAGSVKEGWLSAFITVASIRVVADALLLVVFGAGISAATLDPLSALVGYLSLIPLILGLEAVRVYIIRRGGSSAATIIGTALIMTLVLLIPYPRMAQLFRTSAVAWAYLTRYLIPSFAHNLVLSELAAWWGFRASVSYSLLVTGVGSLSPLIPDAPWFAVAVFSVMVAVIQVFSIIPANPYQERGKEARARSRRSGMLNKVATAAALIFLAAAVVGLATGFRAMVVVSGSMEPGIQVGDIVVSAPAPDRLEVGDVVAYASPQGIVVHRVISEEVRDGALVYRTKGDANNAPDPWIVPRDAVIGEVVAVLPYLGYPLYYLSLLLGGFAHAVTAVLLAFFVIIYVHERFIGGELA